MLARKERGAGKPRQVGAASVETHLGGVPGPLALPTIASRGPTPPAASSQGLIAWQGHQSGREEALGRL